MSQKIANSLYKFREKFRLVHKEAVHWFPGHMGKGMKQMQQRLKLVDCVIEVHDARIPLTGINPNFRYTLSGVKPHILVLNKKDLTDLNFKNDVESVLKKNGFNDIIYTNSKDPKCSGVRQIIPTVAKLVSNSDRYNRSQELDYCVMVIGVPNVGKSSLINVLRTKHIGKGNAARVGAIAGITRSVQNRIKVCEHPLIYLLDTPGVLTPNINDVDTGMKLALCSCLQDDLVGIEIIADYLLFWLNKNSNFRYVELMNLDEPTDDIGIVLTKCALMLGKTNKIKSVVDSSYIYTPNLSAAAYYFVKNFRLGKLGPVMLDNNLIKP